MTNYVHFKCYEYYPILSYYYIPLSAMTNGEMDYLFMTGNFQDNQQQLSSIGANNRIRYSHNSLLR